MSREISLFAEYHTKENSLTNYCGLILKILYEENPKAFEEVIATLLGGDRSVLVGPVFTQQLKKERSIPDLAIIQKSFSIFFETKLHDWFYSDQIERHIKGLSDSSETKILFLLSNFETEEFETRFFDEKKLADKHNIILRAITFESLIGAFDSISASGSFRKTLDEFKDYLDRSGHLPRWKYLLDVVNCSGTMNEIEEGVYICPATGGAYSHRRAKYFGPYSSKRVDTIFEIDAVVRVDRDLANGEIKWKNHNGDKDQLIGLAIEKIKKWDWRIEENRKVPVQVFLLSRPAITNFEKDSSGGLFSSKIYFWDIAKNVKSSKELAQLLMDRKWSEFGV